MLLQYQKVVILDIEGNSAHAKEELKITQFSAIIIENNEKKEVNFYNRNVNLIPMVVQRLTHLNLAKLKKEGISERRLIQKIYQILKDADVIYAYGYDFDKRMIQLMFDKYHLHLQNMNWVDIQEIAKERLNPKHLNLKALSTELGFNETSFHNSLVDCRAILHIIDYLEAIELETVSV